MAEVWAPQAAEKRDREAFSIFLTQVGDGTGDVNANGDYGGEQTPFFFTPPSGEIAAVSKLRIQIRSTGGLHADLYGTDITMSGGIHVCLADRDFNAMIDFTTGNVIGSNTDWGRFGEPIYSNYDAGDRSMTIEWDFADSGAPVFLNGDDSSRFCVLLQDDFRSLADHTFNIQGFYIR